MSMIFTNNASSKLTEAIAAESSFIKIPEADVVKFPTLTTGKYFYLTLVGDGIYEIVKCTGVSSNVIDITRAQDGTTARSWPKGTIVELRIPAIALNEIIEDIESKAPEVHTSKKLDGATYGMGTYTTFGHVCLTDDLGSTSDQTKGVAATPYAVKQTYEKAASAASAAAEAKNAANIATTRATGAVKSVNNTKPDSSGNVTLSIDAFPSQTGNEGKFLTTDGTTVSWAEISGGMIKALPSNLASLDSVTEPGYYALPANVMGTTAYIPRSAVISTSYELQLPYVKEEKYPCFLLKVSADSLGNIFQDVFVDGLTFSRSANSALAWSMWITDTTVYSKDDKLGLTVVSDTASRKDAAPITLSAKAIHELVDAVPSVTLSDAVDSISSTTAASSAAVKTAYDKAVEAASASSSTAGVPCGTIIYSGSTTTPSGYLKCDGSEVSRETYADLFAAIGTAYGAGDGTSTFNLPNLMNVFIEGNATPGTHLAAGLPNITGTILSRPLAAAGPDGGAIGEGSGSFHFSAQDATTSSGNWSTLNINTSILFKPDHITFNAASSSSIYGNSTTVQPEAYTAIPYIKAFGAVVNEGNLDLNNLLSKVTTLENNALLKSGGTMTGTITVNTITPNNTTTPVSLNAANATQEIRICGGTNLGDGGALLLYGANNTYNTYTPGAFSLQASNGTTTRALFGFLNEGLLWDNIHVMPYKSTAAPSNMDGFDGDVWIQYTA